MEIYKYKDYEEYEKAQKRANIKKGNKVWAVQKNIKFLSKYLRPLNPEMGLCHGVRQGLEQKWFNDYLIGCETIGTEIGDVAGENTVKWDFNKVNPRWIEKFDFIYSNSFDHAFNPELTFNVWAGQIKPGGVIMLEYDKRQEHTGEISRKVNPVDPVSLKVDELIELVPKWNEHATVIDVLDMPKVKKEFQKTVVIKINM